MMIIILGVCLLLCSCSISSSFRSHRLSPNVLSRFPPYSYSALGVSNKPEEPSSQLKSDTRKPKRFKPIYLLPIPLVLFAGYDAAHSELWLKPGSSSGDNTWRYFLAGAVSASFSHGVTVPFDVVKTRIQVNNGTSSMVEMLKTVVTNSGVGALFTGMTPTLGGYFVQGGLKYGFYEIFKTFIKYQLLTRGMTWDLVYIYMVAGGFAELIGSTTLTPFEAARIRLVSDPSYARNPLDCVQKMVGQDGVATLFAGLPAILLKNIPYTVVQLSSFEFLTSAIYSKMADAGFTFEQASHYQLAVTTGSAFVAAVLASLASQPGDSLLSAINKTARKPALINGSSSFSSTFSTPSKEIDSRGRPDQEDSSITRLQRAYHDLGGVKGLFKGTQARLLHVVFIVVIQLVVYDFIKQLCGIPVTGLHH